MINQKVRPWLPWLMVLPAFSIMLFVVILPIFNTVFKSFHNTSGELTLENYTYFFGSAEAFQSLIFTAIVALAVMILSVVLSFLLALYLRFSKSWISRLLGKLYLLPRFIPGIAAVYAVMNVIKDSGTINRVSMSLGVDFKPGLLYDIKGIILCNLWFSIPFAAMMMSAALSAVNDSYIESARDVGSSWGSILTKIILPLTYKDIIVSATFVLMGQIGAFTIPYLTGPNNPKMLGILLYQQAATYMDYERAAALSVLIFLLCLGGAIVYIRANMRDEVWERGK
ncbi:ABC transporter permease [Scatolibacter rhodanostii]|uniref:ABC transporter permease n=1 Tax=Scatolibacter rhodanostii TaxID=2014781 RepID=UPI000C087034|nr:ABC transporter permease [Scatolibacter rhodanostii]